MLEKNGTGQDKLGQVAGLKLMALRKKERARLLPRNLNAIFGENRTVECRGYPKAILFEVGGRCGNIVTKTTTKDVRLAWRVVAINGKEIASSTVREVLQATHRSSRKYTVTFRFGDKKDPEEEEGRAALNIMYDKRVFRGNTHNLNILKQHLTPAQKEE